MGIKQSEIVFTSGNQARKSVAGIGQVLEGKIQSFFRDNSICESVRESSDKENHVPAVNIPVLHVNRVEKIVGKSSLYVPRIGTGPWIILKSFSL